MSWFKLCLRYLAHSNVPTIGLLNRYTKLFSTPKAKMLSWCCTTSDSDDSTTLIDVSDTSARIHSLSSKPRTDVTNRPKKRTYLEKLQFRKSWIRNWLGLKIVTSGGSNGAPGTPHSGPKFLYFHAVFEKNWSKSRLAPPLGVNSAPLCKILDLPLTNKGDL